MTLFLMLTYIFMIFLFHMQKSEMHHTYIKFVNLFVIDEVYYSYGEEDTLRNGNREFQTEWLTTLHVFESC